MRYSNVFPAASLRRYLLGLLADEETERIDQHLLTEEGALEAVEEAQDDLIEDYLDGALDESEHAAFEEHFLAAPAHRQSLDCARMVREHMLREAARVSRFRPRATAAWIGPIAAVLLIGLGLWLWLWLVQSSGPPPQIAEQTPTTTTAPPPPVSSIPGPTSSPVSRPSPAAPVRVAATLVVSQQMAGGEGDPTVVRLRRGETAVQIEIAFLEGAVAYRRLSARLLRDGRVVHEWKSLRPQTDLALDLPTQGLAPGAYTLVLSGSEPGGDTVEVDRWTLQLQTP
jgi:hypothetical protein